MKNASNFVNKEGKYLKNINEELSGGARINYIFSDIFKKAITNMDPFEYLSDQVAPFIFNFGLT